METGKYNPLVILGVQTEGDWNGGKRVYINYNQTFGGVTNNNQNVVALRTGQRPNNTEMFIEVGSNGRIFGAGGRGGHGCNGSAKEMDRMEIVR